MYERKSTSGIFAIVLTAIIGLIGFATRNMRITQTSVDLQNQAKETLNHMTTYVMEGSRVEWDDNKKRLTITKDKIGADHKPESSLASVSLVERILENSIVL